MAKYYTDDLVVKDARETAPLSPVIVDFIEIYNARRKVRLDEWIRYLARERAQDDAESAIHGFIVICVLAAVAISFLIAL